MYILVSSHCNVLVIVTVVASECEREGWVGDFGKWSARGVHEPLPNLAVGRGGGAPGWLVAFAPARSLRDR
jgi:hypothetical protein